MPMFFSRLSYSLGNEDWETEHRALKIKPQDRILCVTGSGDRPLHLLLKECHEVVAIDANPIQNHLLKLKMAAMRHFDYEKYISFLGVANDNTRRSHLRKLSINLENDTAKFWQKNSHMVSKGVLYQGAMEKYARGMFVLARIIQGDLVKKLFSFNDLNDQRSFIDEQWDRALWRMCFQFVLTPKVSRLFLRDPGLYTHVDDSIRPGIHLYQRMNDCLKKHLARDNFFVSLCLRGYITEHALPAYLHEESVKTIQQRLGRVDVQTSDLVSYLKTCPANSFDVFSLSDVASYISEQDFERLLREVRRVARPGARFCIREFLSRRKIPSDMQPFFNRNHTLEKQLEDDDRCFVYRFQTGVVV